MFIIEQTVQFHMSNVKVVSIEMMPDGELFLLLLT